MQTAIIDLRGENKKELDERAIDAFNTYFGDIPWVLIDSSAEAVVYYSPRGSIVAGWSVRYHAVQKDMKERVNEE